jgi:hypothetical protein
MTVEPYAGGVAMSMPRCAATRASSSCPRTAWIRDRMTSAIDSGPCWRVWSAIAMASSASRSAASQSPSR